MIIDLSNFTKHFLSIYSPQKRCNDSPVDGGGLLPVCRDSVQPHPVHTLHISTQVPEYAMLTLDQHFKCHFRPVQIRLCKSTLLSQHVNNTVLIILQLIASLLF